MKVMHVITRLILGGAQENTLLTVEGLLKRGHEVELVTGPAIGPEGELVRRAQEHNVPLVIVGSLRRAINPFRDAAAYAGLVREIRRMRPDVVHTHSSKAEYWQDGRQDGARSGHHSYDSRSAFSSIPELDGEPAVHRVGEAVRAVFDETHFGGGRDDGTGPGGGGGTAEQFVTIYSGMEVGPFLEAKTHRERVRSELGIAANELVVGKIARLSDLKGHSYLLAAAPVVLAKFPQTRFVLVGDGWLRKDLEAEAKRLGIAERILFTGLVPPQRIPELIGAMDVVVHTSLREGWHVCCHRRSSRESRW